MKDIFISFSSKNMDIARDMCNYLEENGYSCFIASRDIEPGREYASQLVERLEGAKVVVLLMSEEANQSPHVLREVEYAVSHKIPIVVYPLEEVTLSKSLEYFLMTHQWLGLDDDKDVKLLKSLDDLLDNQRTQPVKPKEKSASLEKQEYEAEIKRTKRAYGRAFLGMIVFVVVVFILMFSKYVLPDIKGGSSQGLDSSKEIVKEYELGERVIFGKYNDLPIEWRIIHINDDNTAVLLSSDILSIKAFDTAEGGKYNEYDGVDYWTYENHIVEDPNLLPLIRGNNDWSVSNIRTWLNSDSEVVKYEDQAPTRSASCTGNNYYSNEPGFLYNFTEEERNAIVAVKNLTMGNVLSKNAIDGLVETKDYVFLLSKDELKYLEEAGISLYATVTKAAVEKDDSNSVKSFLEIHGIENYYWWLRDHAPDAKVNEGLIVLTEYEDGESELSTSWSVGASSYGIRPAINVDLDKLPVIEEEEND